MLRIYASRESFTSSREREIDPVVILMGLNEEITSILFSTMLVLCAWVMAGVVHAF
jgi:hypothetical protein